MTGMEMVIFDRYQCHDYDEVMLSPQIDPGDIQDEDPAPPIFILSFQRIVRT